MNNKELRDENYFDYVAILGRIEAERIAYGDSIFSLCSAIGYDRSSYSKIVRAGGKLGGEAIAKISVRYKVSTDYIWFGKETVIEKEQRLLIHELRKTAEGYKNTAKILKKNLIEQLQTDEVSTEEGSLEETETKQKVKQ